MTTLPTTLFLDNSRLENYTTCNRKGFYAITQARVPSGESSALNLGSAAHLALRYRYSRIGSSVVTPDLEARQMYLIEKFYNKHHVTNEEEYRTRGYAQNLIIGYNKTYPQEAFAIKSHTVPMAAGSIGWTNAELIEMPFSVALGKVNETDIIWTGKIDLVIEIDSGLYILDHKTASIGGDGYIVQHYNSTQFIGYMYALRESTGITPKGFIVDALFTRKITPTGKGIEYTRYTVDVEPDRIEEWRINTLQICSDYLHDLERSYFPMRQTQCVARFGSCEYHSICTSPESARPILLASEAFKDDTWSPLHNEDEELILEADKLDVSSYTFVQPTLSPKSTKKTIDSNQVLKDLGLA